MPGIEATLPHHLPGIEASRAAPPARHRSPAKPAPQEKKSSCPVGGQLSKVSANLPGRATPARPIPSAPGTQLMMSHMLSPTTKQCPTMSATGSIVRSVRRQNRSNQIESHPKKNPGAGLAFKVTHGL